jgi:intracellular septation protein A
VIKQLIYAVVPLIFDSLGVIVFAVLMAMHVNLVIATLSGVVIAAALVGWELARRKPVPAMQWLSLVLVLLTAGATLITDDPRFVMAKPSVIYAVVGFAMLRRGWMNRYVAPADLAVVEDLMTIFGYIWAGLMFITCGANLVVAIAFPEHWPAFLAIFPAASKAGLFGVQFIVLRIMATRRSRLRETTFAGNA